MNDRNIQVPSLSELHTHRSEKWRAFPHDILPFPVAEMDFPVADPIKEILIEMVSHSDLGYLGPIPEMGEAFAGFSRRRWEWVLDPAQVRIATDVGVAVVEVLRVFTKPGDKILISSPVYQNFYTWINETRLEKVDVPFIVDPESDDRTGWSLDWPGIEKAYADGIKIHLLCSPHNPLGKVFTVDELTKFAHLAKKYDVIVISDEIHAPLTFAETPFIPFLSLGPIAEEVGVTVTAASKGWNIAGLKCALVITQNEKLHSALDQLPPAMHFRASLLGAFATVAAFEKGELWLDSVLTALDHNRILVANLIDVKAPHIGYRIPHASYLAWFDLSKLSLGEDPTMAILDKAKVALNPGHIYSPTATQYARFNFATSPEIITEAFDRIAQAL
jgi:cystathionine beta-lyase